MYRFFLFITILLIYNVVLVSRIQQRFSFTYICMHYFSDSLLLQIIARY